MALSLDHWLLILRHCNTYTLINCAQVSHLCRLMVSTELRRRFMILVDSFFGNRAHDFLALLDTRRAIILGSTALAFLSWQDSWTPGDLDIYVGNNEYSHFIQSLTDLRLAVLETDFGSRSSSTYEGIGSVRRYLSPTGKRIDVIRSVTPCAAHPLLYFWGSLVVNFLTPRGAVCAFPSFTLNHKALVTDVSHSAKLVAARQKYESRGFEFNTVNSWGPVTPTDSKGNRIFSDTPIMEINFLSLSSTDINHLPIVRAGRNWILRPDSSIVTSGTHSLPSPDFLRP